MPNKLGGEMVHFGVASGIKTAPKKAVKWWFVLWDSCFWQACAHGSPRSTSSQSSWPTVTCWTTWGSATERRSMLWCCYTWPHRSPLPWNTWRKKTLYIGGFEGLKSKIANLSWVYKTNVFFVPIFSFKLEGTKNTFHFISHFLLFFFFFSPLLPEQCSSHTLIVSQTSWCCSKARLFWHVQPYLFEAMIWFMTCIFVKLDFNF